MAFEDGGAEGSAGAFGDVAVGEVDGEGHHFEVGAVVPGEVGGGGGDGPAWEAVGNSQEIVVHDWKNGAWAKDMILVGTSGNEIWQLSSDDGSNLNEDGKALMSSHSSSPMGLSVHPNGTFATCGEDGILRVWNLFDHQENLSIDLGMPARSCAFSPESHGRMIAVGFGKPVKDNARTINGKWIILNISDKGEFQIISERRDSRKFITEMKWHSNGDRLAVGSSDKKICVYQLVTETKPATKVDITLLSILDLTSSPVHFDFSRDGKYLKANYECNELHFFEAGPGIHIKESSRLKDTQWETETCVFGWNVQGVWRKEDEAEVNNLFLTSSSVADPSMRGNACTAARHRNASVIRRP